MPGRYDYYVKMEETALNILVLGMGSNVSQGIVKVLRTIEMPLHIIGACISKASVGLYMCDEALLMPKAADKEFIPWYIETCRGKNIDMTFTGVEENIDALVRNRDVIERSCQTKFAYPANEVWKIGLDKYRTCQWLKDNGIPYPAFALASDDKDLSELVVKVGFPLIAKPRRGKSSSGIITAYSLKDLMGIIGDEEYVIQECVGNAESEYTIGCYFSRDGKLQSIITLHRYLKNGGTSMAEIVNDERINEIIGQISEKLQTTGPLNIQMRKRADGTPVCFEWNVRYSGATAIRNHFGFKDVEAAIKEYVLSDEINGCFHVAYSGVAIRLEDEVYLNQTGFEELFSEMKL